MVFEIFRRRQKQMIAALAVLAMFAFVLADAFDRLMSGSNANRDPVIGQAWGAEIYGSQVFAMRRERDIANQFILRSMSRAGVTQVRPPLRDTSAAGVLRSIVLLGKARQMGISVNDGDVTEYIRNLTDDRLSKQAFEDILRGVPAPSEETDDPTSRERNPLGVGDSELYRILGQTILEDRVIEALAPPVILDTPLDAWQSREPTLTEVQLRLVRVPVAKFVDADEQPTDEQLKAVYDEYKDVVGDPMAGVIGFRSPRRIDAQYLVAKTEAYDDQVKVTESEITEYYEENKDQFERFSVPPPPPISPGRDLPPALAPDRESKPSIPLPKPATKKSKPSEKAEPKPSEKTEPKPSEKAEPKPKAKNVEKSEKDPGKKQAEKGKDASDKPKDAGETEKAPSKESSLAPGLRPLLTSALATSLLLQDEKSAAPTAKEIEKAPKQTKPEPVAPTAPKVEKSAKPEPTEDASEKKTKKGAATDAKPSSPEPTKKPGKKAAGNAKDTGAPFGPQQNDLPVEKQYRPLEEVRDDIVQVLKRRKAGEKATEAMRAVLRDVMDVYLDRYLIAERRYIAKASINENIENIDATESAIDMSDFDPPTPPDLLKVAQEHGFVLKSTGLVTEERLEGIEGLGTATRAGGSASDIETFARKAFEDERLFRGRILHSSDDREYYLCWKTNDEPSHAPELAGVREEVVDAWRLQQARPKAEAEAEKLAEAVRNAGGDFTDGLPKDASYVPMTTTSFPRATEQFQQNQFLRMLGNSLQPTKIPEVPDAGAEFLDKVFAMKVGDFAVLPDADIDNYYVVQLKQHKEADFERFVGYWRTEMTLRKGPQMFGPQPEFIRQLQQTMAEIEQEAGLVEMDSPIAQ